MVIGFKDLVDAIDKSVEADDVARDQGRGGRRHLGASVIGHKCARQIWYGWRWVYRVQHTGRILRLFKRGALEEDRFVEYLRGIGLVISETGHDTGNQQIFSDFDGHFGGQGDGRISGESMAALWVSDLFASDGLLECKTHGDKSFKLLVEKGVLTSKLEHYIQMQVYMKYFKLTWGLYFAVNKNTDELHAEFIHYKPEIAEQYSDRANKIIHAQEAPARISNDPSWWECKFCDFREICHHDAVPRKNCRSCIFAKVEGPDWTCQKFHQVIPEDFIPRGCDTWEPVK